MESKLYKICLVVLVMTGCLSSKAETIIAIEKGSWTEHTTWDLDRLPLCGDIVYIPCGIEVTIAENINFEKHGLIGPEMQVFVSGKLSFRAGNGINLSENSSLMISNTGAISKNGQNEKHSSFVSIHLTKVWDSKQGSATGPLVLGKERSLSQELLGFEISSINDTFVVCWSMKQFDDVGYYELSVSQNGKNWESIKRMKALHSDSLEQMLCHVYQAPEIILDSKLYFKLDVCDLNGKITLLAAEKLVRKADRTKAWMTIPKMLITSSVLMFVEGIIYHVKN